MALTLEKLLLLLPYDAKPDQLKTVDLSDKGIVGLPKQTAFLKALRRLSLAKNQLTDITPVASIVTLTHLDLSHNLTLTSLLPLKQLTNLVVLSVGNCGLRSLEGIEGSKSTLKSLVANDNKIILGVEKNAAGLTPIAEANRKALMAVSNVIETIVLSRNPNLTGGYTLAESEHDGSAMSSKAMKREAAGNDDAVIKNNSTSVDKEHIAEDPKNPLHFFSIFEQLRKLSLSECGIKCLPRRWYLPLITELRLANNHITTISNGLLLKSIKTIDVSNNELTHWNCLHRCKFLKQLSIKGNPLSSIDTPMPAETPNNAFAAKKAPAAAGAEGAETAAPEAAKGPSSALHDNPLEILYLRAVMPQLEILDGRKFAEPPVGATAADIQKAISDIHKKEHLARKARLAKEGGGASKAAGGGSDDDDDADDEAVAKAKAGRKAGSKSIRMGMGDDEDEDAAMDASLMARRRRRAEEDGDDAPAPKAPTAEKKERVPLPPTEDKEYEVPTAILQKVQQQRAGAPNLVKRERKYAVGESANTNANNTGGNKKKKEERVVVSSGSDLLAALRGAHADTSGGW